MIAPTSFKSCWISKASFGRVAALWSILLNTKKNYFNLKEIFQQCTFEAGGDRSDYTPVRTILIGTSLPIEQSPNSSQWYATQHSVWTLLAFLAPHPSTLTLAPHTPAFLGFSLLLPHVRLVSCSDFHPCCPRQLVPQISQSWLLLPCKLSSSVTSQRDPPDLPNFLDVALPFTLYHTLDFLLSFYHYMILYCLFAFPY